MPFRPCVSGCGRYLAPGDGHDRCLSCLGIEHAEAAFVDELCPHCGGMTVAGLRTRLRFLQRGGVPVPLPRSRVPPGGYRGEATSGRSRAGLTVTVRNSPSTARAPPVTGTSLPMELPRERAGPSHGGGGTACILWRSPRRSDVDRYIGGWVRPIRRWWFSTAATLRAVSGAGFGSGNGGYACPGRWECWARVDASTVSRTLKAGRLVSRGGPRWFSGPHPGAFLPGSAWWAHWNMDGTFHCQKPLQWLILPRHPWRRSGAGVYGGPAGGAIGCDAIVSKDRFYLAR